MSEELKPVNCGCGGEPVVGHIETSGRWYIGCPDCDICTGLYDTKAEVIEAWNKAMGERTAKAKVNFKDENYFFGWCECGQYQSSQFPYCPACGCRLEWE